MNIKKDFPIFNNNKLIYFDNAATSQKPQQVIDSLVNFYTKNNANVHRGIYSFSEYATTLFEKSRKKISRFINAQPEEIIFTQGTTASINFVAIAWADKFIKSGDEIIISQMEHHSNILPWQQIAAKKGAALKVIKLTHDFQLDLQNYESLLSSKTKLVAITHISNVLGTHNDIDFITKKAQEFGAKVLIDAAQSIAHAKIDVKKINCDFLAFSGHKMLGPTGIGVLYIKKELFEEIEPIYFGGGMVFEADINNPTWLKSPYKFEAGTPPIAEAIGLATAIDYISANINFDKLRKHEANLCELLIEGLLKYPEIKILGPIEQLKEMGHIVSFTIKNLHAHDIAAYFDQFSICVRAGHHCTQPLHKALGIESSIRVSFYGYNTPEEVQFFLEKLHDLALKI